MKTALRISTLLFQAYSRIPFFNRGSTPRVCTKCSIQVLPNGKFRTSYSKGKDFTPNECWTKICRHSQSEPGCINNRHTGHTVKSLDWTIGANGMHIDTSPNQWLAHAKEVKAKVDQVLTLKKMWGSGSIPKFTQDLPKRDLHLESYLFWTTLLFLAVVVFLLTLRLELLSMADLLP
jgi:hypothetical protein